MGLELHIRLDKEAVPPGGELQGTVDVLEGDTARTTTAALRRVEMTNDYTETLESIDLGTIHTGDLATGMSIPFTGQMPANARPNVVSHGSIIWRIEVEVDRKGFNKSASLPVVVDAPAPDEPPEAPTGRPITAGGKGETRGPIPPKAIAGVTVLLLGVAAFFAWQKISSHDDPIYPVGAALERELEQEFGDTAWIGFVTDIEGDDPDPGDLSIDTGMSKTPQNTRRADAMCDDLLGYAETYGVTDPSIFIHSTEDSYVAGQIILGTDWLCDRERGLRDF